MQVHNAATEGFVKGVEYDKHRPSYTDEAIDYIVKHTGLNSTHDKSVVVVELGSGTGKFTKRILPKISKDVRYIATDPSSTFLDQLKINCSEVDTRVCSADDIPLPDSSVEVVIGAQCFHWFANEASLNEIHRVLTPGGKIVMIWNNKDVSVKWVKDLKMDFLGDYYTPGTPRAILYEWKAVIDKCSLFSGGQQLFYPGIQIKGTKETIVDHFSTISVIAKLEDEEKQVALSRLMDLLNTHPDTKDKDEITLPFITEIYHCNKVS